MSDNTSIEWANAGLPRGASWNPIRARHWEIQSDGGGKERIGWHCTHASEGCRNCYAEGINKRLGTSLPYKPGHEKDIEIFLDEKTLLQPLKWRDPRGIFVCSMTDAFADFVSDRMLDQMFAVAALATRHRFLWLTKRTERMRNYCSRKRAVEIAQAAVWLGVWDDADSIASSVCAAIDEGPLPNVWLGTSVEDQATADARIPHLLATPAAVRFVSYEPALGPVDFTNHDPTGTQATIGAHGWSSIWKNNAIGRAWLDWVICGGESGPHARPMHPDWARSVRDQCAAAGVAYFHKQNGEFVEFDFEAEFGLPGKPSVHHDFPDGQTVFRVGKKLAGRKLDGREHNEMPEVRS